MYKKYETYEIDDFLLDENFINWVLSNENDKNWKSWLKEHPRCGERIQEARLLVNSLRFLEEKPTEKEKKGLWIRIENSTRAKEVNLPTKFSSVIWKSLASAAAIALLFFFYLTLKTPDIVKISSESVSLENSFPDESVAILYDSSEIVYDKTKWKMDRKVKLQGTATFDVQKGVPFTVTTENGEVRVLGTRFTVYSKGLSFDVFVERGKVEVISEGVSNILTAGMRLSKNLHIEESGARQGSSQSYVPQTVFYQYKDVSFDEPLAVLAEIYDVEFIIPENYPKQRYTGFFNSGDSLPVALNKFFWPLNTEFEIKGNKVEVLLR